LYYDLFRRRFEIAGVRWRLALLGRHEKIIAADKIILPAEEDVAVVLGAFVEKPDRIVLSLIMLVDRAASAHDP
jgi:hypothetical protein